MDEFHPHVGDAVVLHRCIGLRSTVRRRALCAPVFRDVRGGHRLRQAVRVLGAGVRLVGLQCPTLGAVRGVFLLRCGAADVCVCQLHHGGVYADDFYIGTSSSSTMLRFFSTLLLLFLLECYVLNRRSLIVLLMFCNNRAPLCVSLCVLCAWMTGVFRVKPIRPRLCVDGHRAQLLLLAELPGQHLRVCSRDLGTYCGSCLHEHVAWGGWLAGGVSDHVFAELCDAGTVVSLCEGRINRRN
jgi:hypothetical protein